MRENQRLLAVISVAMCGALFSTGCAAVKVSSRSRPKDLTVLERGKSRSQVVSELGTPVLSRQKDGETIDTFSFDPGLSGGAKFSRALFHVGADLFTVFLWELVAWPAESAAAAGKKNTKVEVAYDKDENVKLATFLK